MSRLAPLTAEARVAMLWLAIEAGGDGAWLRLIDDPEASPSEALRSASGMTPAQLGLMWHEEVMRHKPEVYAGSLPVSWVSLFWIALLVGLAMRSTRWRLA